MGLGDQIILELQVHPLLLHAVARLPHRHSQDRGEGSSDRKKIDSLEKYQYHCFVQVQRKYQLIFAEDGFPWQ